MDGAPPSRAQRTELGGKHPGAPRMGPLQALGRRGHTGEDGTLSTLGL